MKFTIKEMAQKAGVSVATISRALNAETRSKVATETLEKVDTLIQKHGYTPNLAAKILRQSATKTVGVILPYVKGVFYQSYYEHILSGIADALFHTEYQFKLLLLREEKMARDRYDFQAGERVDGLIITHWAKFFSHKKFLEKINIPCVVINDYDKNIKAQFVSGDHFSGGQKAAEYLYAQGHRRFGVLTGAVWSRDSQARLEGFKSFLEQRGVILNPENVINADYSEEAAFERVGELFKNNLTAIFCCNDQMAWGVLKRLKKEGFSCPEDISIVGYDNDWRTALCAPPLTTIDVPIYELAKSATKLLIDHLQGQAEKPFVKVHFLPVELVERKSVQSIPAV